MGGQYRATLRLLTLLLLHLARGHPVGTDNNGEELSSDPRYLFPCNRNTNIRSGVEPTSVHSLSPSDIKVISTLRSLNIKSDDSPNKSKFARLEQTLLRASQLTESYVGQKLYYSVSNVSPVSQNNLVDEAKNLVQTLKQDLVVSFADDWKMILIFVTAEDPCNFCVQEDHTEHKIRELSLALDYLQQEMPKTLVSLVDLTLLSGLFLSNPENSDIRETCECFRKPSVYYKAMLRFSFQSALERIISSKRYDTREDFTVVLHPVLHMVDSEKKNINNYGEVYEVQCSEQATPFLNTHKNSPYVLLNDMMGVEKSGPQERKVGSNFTCADLSPSDAVPTSVHNLKAADFKVIGALGDSLTAGNGAGAFIMDILDVVSEYRGMSWSIGGDEDLSNVTTLANILRMFNPGIQGYSIGKGFHVLPRSALNRAVPGAKADDMLEQSQNLVTAMKRMNSSRKINYAEDWKLLTIFIGGNDLCGICKDPIYHSPEQFVYRIKQALDYLQKEVPRMFVNLVTILDIIPLKEMFDDDRTHCPRRMMSALCGCVVDYPEGSTEIEVLRSFNKQYQEKTRQLVESGLYDTTDDFTVVIQPFLEHLELPRTPEGFPDRTFMAPDCFHFGAKAHAQSALGLWINMFEPVGQKSNKLGINESIGVVCPPQGDPYVKTAKNSNYVYPTVTTDPVYGSQVQCADRSKSPQVPTSVHALRPADITVVAALGDSLTAGNGIGSNPGDVLDVLSQYRGLSWSIGGDGTLDHVTTLPNILLEFNPFVTGYSTDTGKNTDPLSFLNEAVPGAKSFDMLTQARALIDQMNSDKRIRNTTDWKIITVFIGANDLCAACTDSNFFSATNYISRIREALDLLHQEVPRAFVNLVEVMDIFPLRDGVLDNRVECPTFLTKLLCPCVLSYPMDSYETQIVKDTNLVYQSSLRQLVDSGRYDTRDDFTVVLQPFFRNIKIPYHTDGTPDVSYLAPDCFHLSQKSHSQLARMLWNNMLEPVGQKTDTLDLAASLSLKCPTEAQPFLRTYKNSNYNYPPVTTPAPITNWGSDMECRNYAAVSDSVPTSVNKLRPGDIRVVAALGDSLTAGFGARATSILNVATEWRGISWSIGGDDTLDKVTTIPNILKKFNPNVKGYSTGTGRLNEMFNVAVSGAKAENITTQARTLVNKMKESTVINFENDWKLITIFIGGNDLCQYCHNRTRYSLENHMKHLQTALDIFYDEVPRAFINLVEIMEIEGLRAVTADTIGCSLLKPNACPCFINPRDGSPELNQIKKFNRDLQVHLAQLPEKYTEREDFAAVAQPFFRNTIVPVDNLGQPDVSYFSKDCFHFHERGHAEMAKALWNNMLEPVGQKTDYNNYTYDRNRLKCPTNDRPYLFTLKNSGLPQDLVEPEKDDGDQVPMWSVIVASIGGVALGCLVVGIAMNMSFKKKLRKQTQNRSSF
ncbi:phospholipase B1, membrane-associated [Lithobates pipiens]